MSEFEEWKDTVYLKKRVITSDEEGGDITSYSNKFTKLQMDVQSAGGQVQAQIWGTQLPYIKTCYYEGNEINEGENEKDGICYKVDSSSKPDYEIISIQEYSEHKVITLKKLVV
ncbi:hypothetical protein [Vagococcus fluvialis]|uniref:hypothetical protein n=1 Tax=Vagococcus fluvialis TaxID=2738 RepID=UPI001D0BDFAB|nr:hypothetical protein [Vagococcus fluvialis]UDM74991.1 hypothetical protein K5K99_05290 [Vagococcus fluvialis]